MSYLVIKCGGSVLQSLPRSFYENVVHLQNEMNIKPIIVHGGGPLISSLLSQLGVETKFVNGLRVTTNEVLDIVEMVLSGSVNKKIVRHLATSGGKAYGISGIDGALIKAEPVRDCPELGFVGNVEHIDVQVLKHIIDQGHIPVISPLGIDEEGQRYNINGDTASSAIAKALGANLCFISDVSGIYKENDAKKTLTTVTKEEVLEMMQQQLITGGMIPKVIAAIDALDHGVAEASIINGYTKDTLVNFCKGKETGTKIILGKEVPHV